jgi:hypothetical protein
MRIDTKTAAKVIRKALKSKCKTLKVRIARGTAYGWIDIWGSGELSEFTDEEKKVLEEFGLNHGANCAVISPDDVDYWVQKLCKLVPEAEALLVAEAIKGFWRGSSCEINCNGYS